MQIIEPKRTIFTLKIGASSNEYYIEGTELLSGVDELNIIAAMVNRIRSRAIEPEQQEVAEQLLEIVFSGRSVSPNKNGVTIIHDDELSS